MAQIHSNPREIAYMKKLSSDTEYVLAYLRQTFFHQLKIDLKNKRLQHIRPDDGNYTYIFLPHRRKLLKYFSLSAYHTLSHVSVILSAIASLLDIPSGFRDSAQIISVTRFVFPHPCRNPSSVDVFSEDLKKKKKNPLEL